MPRASGQFISNRLERNGHALVQQAVRHKPFAGEALFEQFVIINFHNMEVDFILWYTHLTRSSRLVNAKNIMFPGDVKEDGRKNEQDRKRGDRIEEGTVDPLMFFVDKNPAHTLRDRARKAASDANRGSADQGP